MKNSADLGGYYPTKAKLNNCFIIHYKCFPVHEGVSPFRSLFLFSPKNSTTRSPGFLGQLFNNLKRAALLMSFWRHWLKMTKFFPNFVNSSWLWWIMRVVVRNGEIFWMNKKISYETTWYGLPKSIGLAKVTWTFWRRNLFNSVSGLNHQKQRVSSSCNVLLGLKGNEEQGTVQY